MNLDSLFSRFFHKRPPDGLLEFVERVYVFDSCFSTEVLDDEMYRIYLHETVNELHEEFPDSSFLAFNFREGEKRSHFAEVLCQYDVTVMDYPRQYEGCPLLPLSYIQHFLRVCESWLSLGNQQNVILLHCERGGWPLLAFLLSGFLIFRKIHSGERKTLEIVHKEAPKGYVQLLSPLNPLPSQLRYLQYITRRNMAPEWPPPERALSLDCLILRAIPSFDSQNGCRPFIRIFGRKLLNKGGLSTQMLFSMSKTKKTLRHYHQADCGVIKIDIQCLVQGDVVLECAHVDVDSEREVMMFRVMFSTAFIRSNILMLNSDNLDILWDSKERFPKGFHAEVLFGEVENFSPPRAPPPTTILNGEEKGGLPIEAFSRVQELFGGVDWVDSGDDAALWLLKRLSALNDAKELTKLQNKGSLYASPADSEDDYNASSAAESSDEAYEPISKRKLVAAEAMDYDSSDAYSTSEVDLSSDDRRPSLSGEIVTSNSPDSVLFSPPPPPPLPLSSSPPPRPPPPPPPLTSSLVSSEILPPSPLPPPVSSTSKVPSPPPPPPPPPPPFMSAIVSSPPVRLAPPPPVTSSSKVPPSPPPSLGSSKVLTPPPPAFPSSKSTPSLSSPLAPPPKLTSLKPSPSPPPPPPPPPTIPSSRSSASIPMPPPPPPTFSSRVSSAPTPPFPPPPPPSLSSRVSSTPIPPPPPGLPTRVSFAPPQPPPPPPPPLRGAPPPPLQEAPPPPPPPPPPLQGAPPLRGVPPPPPPPLRGAPPPPPPPLRGAPPPLQGAPSPPPPPPGAPNPPPPPPSGPGRPSAGPRPPNAPPPPPTSKPPGPPPPPGSKGPTAPPAPSSLSRGRSFGSATHTKSRPIAVTAMAPKKASLKPLHWVKVTRAAQGSLWADSQKQENQSRAPEIDISELESLFSAATSDRSGINKTGGRRSNINKPEKVQLVDLRRAYNCEIMLSKIKIPLPDMINAVLALDSSTLDIDQVENLIKFCPTKEEMETLKNYAGDKEMLGKCEQFFTELMKVPRVESKLRVFAFKITFSSQVQDLRTNLSTVNEAAREVKESVKLRQIMQTILTLGNALNQGTARGSAIGFKLDSLLKLSDTRATNNKMTLMHYLCKLLSEKMPELLDFSKDLPHLEGASKIQLKSLAEEMQAVSKGLEKVEKELTDSENDGAISIGFQKVLKGFLDTAEAEVRSLISLYTEVGRNADSLCHYFGEDPNRCPFEQVTQILAVFVKMFNKSRGENEKQADVEKKKLEKEAMKEKAAANSASLRR